MKSRTVVFSFLLSVAIPQVGRAEVSSRITQSSKRPDQAFEIASCLELIEKQWFAGKSSSQSLRLTGSTRHETACEMVMNLSPDSLQVSAMGSQNSIQFNFADSTHNEIRTLQTCRVDKEKLHIVFEERTTSTLEKRERIQMTLLKRHGKGLSLILSKRENKILRPLQQSSLICHLGE